MAVESSGHSPGNPRLYELIEYQPVTQSVDVVPAVMIPSPVCKYYLYELTAGSTSVSANFRTLCSNPGSSSVSSSFIKK